MMIPMLSNVDEVRQVLDIVRTIRNEFASRGVEFDPDMAIGGMIEVPAAAVSADLFAAELDFLSIGTNDLIQYTLAIDRVNDEVNYLYDPFHPGVLRLIATVLDAGTRAGIPVAMCGEMAGDRAYTRLLLGLGLTEFSVHPAALLEIKHIINNTVAESARAIARELLDVGDGATRRALLEELNASEA
jgi:phosphotransferase system enzyme I (PtsI)